MALEPWKLLFRHNEKVSSLDLGPSLSIYTYFSKNPYVSNMPTTRERIHFGGHVCGFKVFFLALNA